MPRNVPVVGDFGISTSMEFFGSNIAETPHERPSVSTTSSFLSQRTGFQFSFLTTVNRIRSFQTCIAYFIHSFAFAFSVTILFHEDDSNHPPDKVPTTIPPHAWDPSSRSHCPRRLRSRFGRFRSRRSSICASTKVQS
jgi:hypothetical protein